VETATTPTVKPTVESIPLINLKRDQIHSPTSLSNPAKKRARVDTNASVFAPFSPPITCGWSDGDSLSLSVSDLEDDNYKVDSEETVPTPGPDPTPLVVSAPKSKITAFWKIATHGEKEETNQREFQKLRDNFETMAFNIAEEKRWKLARGRAQARDRQQTHRDRSKEKKMEAGWVPGAKRVMKSFYAIQVEADFKQFIQKRTATLDAFDTTQSVAPNAEASRPRRQFKEDQRLKNKPAGRKRKREQTEAKYVNWFTPFLWSQIEDAVIRAGKPWSPRQILRESKNINPKSFSRLTEQLIGRWIDPEAKKRGVSRWKESVINLIKKGNAPGGDSTRAGILVRKSLYLQAFFQC
jgi:hypothetical protein